MKLLAIDVKTDTIVGTPVVIPGLPEAMAVTPVKLVLG